MAFDLNKSLAAGTKVKVAAPMEVPEWSTWDDDGGRISSPVKKRLQQLFFRGDKKISAEIVYISTEDERERLRRKSRTKIRIRDQSGCAIIITADPAKLVRSRSALSEDDIQPTQAASAPSRPSRETINFDQPTRS